MSARFESPSATGIWFDGVDAMLEDARSRLDPVTPRAAYRELLAAETPPHARTDVAWQVPGR